VAPLPKIKRAGRVMGKRPRFRADKPRRGGGALPPPQNEAGDETAEDQQQRLMKGLADLGRADADETANYVASAFAGAPSSVARLIGSAFLLGNEASKGNLGETDRATTSEAQEVLRKLFFDPDSGPTGGMTP
jgi:hypothetical protein